MRRFLLSVGHGFGVGVGLFLAWLAVSTAFASYARADSPEYGYGERVKICKSDCEGLITYYYPISKLYDIKLIHECTARDEYGYPVTQKLGTTVVEKESCLSK